MKRKNMYSIFIIFLISILSIQGVKSAETTVLYYEDFNEECACFESPYITDDLAYNNNSALISLEDNLLQFIRIYPNIELKERTDLEFYWRNNASTNYSIGFLIQFEDDEEYIFGMMIDSEGEPYVPTSIHSFYMEEEYEHRVAKNEWIRFYVSDLGQTIEDSMENIGVQCKDVLLKQITFFVFQINQSGCFMLDDVKITHYDERETESTDGLDPFSEYMTIILVIMGLVISLLLVKKRTKKPFIKTS